MQKFCDKIDALNNLFGQLAAWSVLVMVFITFLVVVLRYGF
ncbi:MAG: C4-dicarboxylate ABC transporter permease, partial [Nitrosomonadaceae bacterium]|nr:C4-dicarboxylate ABC transporter permease [Nitrosomonadaceae bacterium]